MKNSAIPIKEIPVSKIIIPNPRTRDEERKGELAENIRVRGLIHPIKISEEGDGSYTLVWGQGRLEAVKDILGQKTIRAIVVKGLTKREILLEWLTENLQRVDLSKGELAENIRRLVDECGYTFEKVSKRLGMSISYAHNLYIVAKQGSQKLKEALDDGKINEAASIVRKIKDKETQDKLLDFLRDNKIGNQKQRMSIISKTDPKQPLNVIMQSMEFLNRQIRDFNLLLQKTESRIGLIQPHLQVLSNDPEFLRLVTRNNVMFVWEV